MNARRVLAAIAVAVVAFAVWDDEHGPGPAGVVNVTPRHPELVGFRVGAFRGVHLGETTAGVVATLGPAGARPATDAHLPSGPADATGLDYSGMTVYTRDDRVVWIVITTPNAETRFGVGVGDSLAIARRAYPRLGCSEHESSDDEGNGYGPPICLEHLHPGVNIDLIGDPIVTIVVHGTHPQTPL